MKKNYIKRVAVILLAVMAATCIVACGKGKDKGDKVVVLTPEQIAQTAKEHIYRFQDFADKFTGENLSVLSTRKADGGIEFLAKEENDEGSNAYFCSMQNDGSGFSALKFDLSGKLKDADDEDSYVFLRYGALSKENAYIFYEKNTYVLVDDDWVSNYEYYVVCYDKKGNYQWKTKVDDSAFNGSDYYSYVAGIASTSDNGVALIITGDKGGVIRVDDQGNASNFTAASKDYLSNSPDIFQRSGDGVYLLYFTDDWTKCYLVSFDPEKNSFGKEQDLTICKDGAGLTFLAEYSENEIVYSNMDGVYRFKFGDSSVTKMMDYVNSDIDTYSLRNMLVVDEEHLFATYEDRNDYSTHPCFCTYVKPEDVKDKKTLVLAGLFVDVDERSNVIQFNRNSDDYRIVVKDYSADAGETEQGLVRLNNDILAGNIPDIILLDSIIPLDSYVDKGLLANVDDLIKKDSELSKLEYFDNVFEAYRKNGVLYQVIPRFVVRTYAGKKSILGDRKGITMAEANKLVSDMGGEQVFDGGYTRDGFLAVMMNYCGSDFVDVKAGKVNFDSQEFIDFLQYANTLPEKEQDSGYDEEYWEEYFSNYYSQYRRNRTLLYDLRIEDVNDMVTNTHGMLGDEAAYVGFPTAEGTGSYIEIYTSYALSAKSENQAGAWEYVRRFLGEDYQRNEDHKYGYLYGMPVIKKFVVDEMQTLKDRPYWTNYDGEKEYYDITFHDGNEEIVLEPFTQKEVDTLIQFITSVKKPEFQDETVMEIVMEEVGAFFAGSKSAKDVAGTIQNRVQLYVNENK